MGKTRTRKAAASGEVVCTHKHDPKYASCFSCMLARRAIKRVAAGGLTRKERAIQRWGLSAPVVAEKPKASNGHSNGSAKQSNGEVASLRAEVADLKQSISALVSALTQEVAPKPA